MRKSIRLVTGFYVGAFAAVLPKLRSHCFNTRACTQGAEHTAADHAARHTMKARKIERQRSELGSEMGSREAAAMRQKQS